MVVHILPVVANSPASENNRGSNQENHGKYPVSIEGSAELQVPVHLEVVQDGAQTCTPSGQSDSRTVQSHPLTEECGLKEAYKDLAGPAQLHHHGQHLIFQVKQTAENDHHVEESPEL